MKKQIVDELDGVGKKIADHWTEVLEDVRAVDPRHEAKEDGRRRSWTRRPSVVEEGEYVAKIKPELDDEIKALWLKREEIDDRRPPSCGRSGSGTRSSRGSGGSRAAYTARCAATMATARRSSRIGFRGPARSADYIPPDSRRSWCSTRPSWRASTPRCRPSGSAAPSARRRGLA